jgi:hypothetical protein
LGQTAGQRLHSHAGLVGNASSSKGGNSLEISRLAVTLLTFAPHAADRERVFSTFGWLTGKLLSSMLASNMHMLAKVAKHYRQRPPPK